jgi:hypothetical protein
MTVARTSTRKAPNGYRLAVILIGGSLLLGLAVGVLSYLSSSLVIGPAWRASADELRERGARIYFESCAQFAEPRFWPECIGDADEKRSRGATQLVLFCTDRVLYKRFFGPEDCLAEDRPPLALTGGPRIDHLASGGVVAVGAFAALGLLSVSTRVLGLPGRQA